MEHVRPPGARQIDDAIGEQPRLAPFAQARRAASLARRAVEQQSIVGFRIICHRRPGMAQPGHPAHLQPVPLLRLEIARVRKV
jgi:hypothetical protein